MYWSYSWHIPCILCIIWPSRLLEIWSIALPLLLPNICLIHFMCVLVNTFNPISQIPGECKLGIVYNLSYTLHQLIVSAVWANQRITAQYVPTESCAMFWYLHINSSRNAFAWLNDTIRTDLGAMFNIQRRLLQIIYFILGQYAKLFCQVITELFILCTRIGTQNKCQNYGMHFLATQMLSSLDGGSTLPPFCSIHIKMWRWSRGTASPLAISVCLYQQKLFWYHQNPYIPTEAKLYPKKPKCTHTVNRAFFVYYIKLCASFQIHRWIQTGVTARKCSIRVEIGDILSCVTLKFDGWPWKTIGYLFHTTSSFVHNVKSIGEVKLGLQPGNAQFGSKLVIFCPAWPWNLMDDLKNNRAPLLYYIKLCASFQSHGRIQTGVTVRKRSIQVKISHFLSRLTLKLWRMTLKNNMAPLLCNLKLCASFHSHRWIQTGVTVRKRQFGSKSRIFLGMWPWNLMEDPVKQ